MHNLFIMMFLITALDECRRIRKFVYKLRSLEANLEFIHQVRSIGHSVLGVHLIDRNGLTNIPLETFDDESALIALNQLEDEWTAILAG